MKIVSAIGILLSNEERELLFNIFYKINDVLFKTWFSLSNYSENIIFIKKLKLKVKAEINTSCDEIIQFIESDFIQKDKSIDAIIHYKCMKAVQYGNKSMIAVGDDKDNNIRKSREIFEEAMLITIKSIQTPQPFKLTNVLKISTFNQFQLAGIDEALVSVKKTYNEENSCHIQIP